MVTERGQWRLKLYPRATLLFLDARPQAECGPRTSPWFSTRKAEGSHQAANWPRPDRSDRDYFGARRRTRSPTSLGSFRGSGPDSLRTGDFSHLSEAATTPAMPNWCRCGICADYGAWAVPRSAGAQRVASCILRLRPPLRIHGQRPRPGWGTSAVPDTQASRTSWAHLGRHVGRCRHRPQTLLGF